MITHKLRELADFWRQRYGFVVTCRSEDERGGEIAVSMSFANGEMSTFDTWKPEDFESWKRDREDWLRQRVEGTVEAQG